jgi:hypothetical protein
MCSDQAVQVRGIEPVKVCGIRQSTKTQNAKVRFTYINSDLSTQKDIDVDVHIVGVGTDLIYQIGNRDVKFTLNNSDSTLSYDWDFGDGTTDFTLDPKTIHRYSNEGHFTATVNVNDENFNLLYSEKATFDIVDMSHMSLGCSREKSIFLSVITPTTVAGFTGQYQYDSWAGICYVKKIEYQISQGFDCYWLPLYNCKFDGLLP